MLKIYVTFLYNVEETEIPPPAALFYFSVSCPQNQHDVLYNGVLHFQKLFEIWSLYGDKISTRDLLGCDAVQWCRIPALRRAMLPSIQTEDGGSNVLRNHDLNVRNYLRCLTLKMHETLLHLHNAICLLLEWASFICYHQSYENKSCQNTGRSII